MKAIAIIIVAGCLLAMAGCSQNSNMLTPGQTTVGQLSGAVHATPADRNGSAPNVSADHNGSSHAAWQFQDTDEAKATGEWYGIIGPPFGWDKN